jgi:Predicted membrane protein
LPRAWLAIDELVATEKEELEIIRTGKLPKGQSWKPLQTVLVEAPTGTNLRASTTTGSAEVTRHESNRVEVKTASVAPAILVLSENYYPGWRAYLDGHPVKTLRVDYNLRGVALPAGSHLIKFVYQPKSVLIGLLVSLSTLVLLGLWATGAGARLTAFRGK